MRVGIFKVCYNIKWKGKETGVILYEITEPIKEILSKGHQVDVITIDRYHKDAPEGVNCYTWNQLIEEKIYEQWDVAILFNGPFNAYGGKIGDPALYSYRFLKETRCPVIFCVTDTAIPLSDVSGWINNAQKKGSYLDLESNDFDFSPSKIHCLTQTHDIEKFKGHWKPKQNKFGSYEYFPFHMYAMKKPTLQFDIDMSPQRDLIYFGNERSGKRNEKFAEFFCDQKDLIVDVYGKWNEKKVNKMCKFQMPNLLGPIDTHELNREINASIATVYISDKFNEDCIWTTRFYEAVFNRTIMFVDADNDPKKTKFDDFFYVSSKEELNKKVNMLKKNPTARVQLLNKQFTALKDDLMEMKNFPNKWDEIIRRISNK